MKQLENFWRPVFLLVSGNGLGQLISFLALPVLTRLYLPEDFGIFSIYVAVIATLLVVVNGGYEWAVMLPDKHEEAISLVSISWWVAIGITLCVSIGIFFLGSDLLTYLNMQELMVWKWLLPASLILEGVLQPIRIMINRIRKYRFLVTSRVGKTIAQVSISLIAGFMGVGFKGLLWGYLAGQVLCMLLLLIPYLAWLRQQELSISLNPTRYHSIRKEYADFPRFSILSTLLTTASKQLPYFLVPLFYTKGISINGWMSKAEQILLAPVGLISVSVGNVFFERASKAKRSGAKALADETWQTFFRLSILGLPFLLSILITGPWLFKWVLGPEWETAGVYARWLSPSMYLLFISSPLSCLVDIQRTLRTFLLINILVFTSRFLLIWIGGTYFPPLGMVKLYGIGSIFIVIGQIIYFMYIGTRGEPKSEVG